MGLYSERPLTVAELRFAIYFNENHNWRPQRDFETSDLYVHQRDMEKVVRSRTASLVESRNLSASNPSDHKVFLDPARLPVPHLESESLYPDEKFYLGENLEWKCHPSGGLQMELPLEPPEGSDSDLDSDISYLDSSDDSDDSYDDGSSLEGQSWLSKQQVAQFFHSSVKEYFMKHGLQVLGLPAKSNTHADGHGAMARSCINYLRISELRSAGLRLPEDLPRDDDKFHLRKLFRRHPFLRYVLYFWDQHAEQAGSLSPSQQSRKEILKYFVEGCCTLGTGEADVDIIAGLLHLTISKNLLSCASSLIEMCPNMRHPAVSVALQTALGKGLSHIVRQMIDAGANSRYKESEGYSFLITAAKNNDIPTLNLLIDAGNDVNALDLEGATALLNAAKLGPYNHYARTLQENGHALQARPNGANGLALRCASRP